MSSRIDSAQLILDTLRKQNRKLTSFISASAVGYYGTKTIYNEKDAKGQDFLSDVCTQWEQVADDFFVSEITASVVKLRIGVVLSNTGGALNKMMMPINYYVGAVLGTGHQYMPWIHIDDLCDMIKYLIKNKEIHGVFNAVATEPITNKVFTKMLAHQMGKPLVIPPIPSFIINLIFGEVARLLLKGSRISSKKIRDEGFVFTYPALTIALKNLIPA